LFNYPFYIPTLRSLHSSPRPLVPRPSSLVTRLLVPSLSSSPSPFLLLPPFSLPHRPTHASTPPVIWHGGLVPSYTNSRTLTSFSSGLSFSHRFRSPLVPSYPTLHQHTHATPDAPPSAGGDICREAQAPAWGPGPASRPCRRVQAVGSIVGPGPAFQVPGHSLGQPRDSERVTSVGLQLVLPPARASSAGGCSYTWKSRVSFLRSLQISLSMRGGGAMLGSTCPVLGPVPASRVQCLGPGWSSNQVLPVKNLIDQLR
jgi:hypothetical protein